LHVKISVDASEIKSKYKDAIFVDLGLPFGDHISHQEESNMELREISAVGTSG